MESFTEFATGQGFVPEPEMLRFARGTSASPAGLVPEGATGGVWIHLERLRKADEESLIFTQPPPLTPPAKGNFFPVNKPRSIIVWEINIRLLMQAQKVQAG